MISTICLVIVMIIFKVEWSIFWHWIRYTYVASPDINTEDFQAAVDFLSVQENVDPERIGIIGICGWGGMALNVAAIDTRIKATVASTMYDMTRVNATRSVL